MKVVTLQEIQVGPEGLTINGTWNIDVPTPAPPRFIQLMSSVVEAGPPTKVGPEKSYVVPDSILCKGGTFPYQEFSRPLRGSFYLALLRWKDPVKIQWSMEHWRIPWSGSHEPQRTALMPLMQDQHYAWIQTDLSFEAPLPHGPTLFDQLNVVEYSIVTDRTVTISYNPSK